MTADALTDPGQPLSPGTFSETAASVPEVRVLPRKALPFFQRHPWVYHSAIAKLPEGLAAGAAVRLVAADGQFIAHGLFNPSSNLRVRLYSWDPTATLDREFWSRRLAEAIALRRQWFGDFTPDLACRLVFSEADRLSGMTVDRFGDWLTVLFTSRAMAERQALLLDLLEEQLSPRGIVLRTEKGMRQAEGMELAEGHVRGAPPPQPLIIREHGVQFAVDLAGGQKTGFFLDQRDNRRLLTPFVRGQRVLDLFSYSGGFGLNALVNGGAAEVLAVDASEAALQLAATNAALNGVADRLRTIKGDGFEVLETLVEQRAQFPAIVLDPPKLVRNRDRLEAGLRGYYSLNRLALKLLAPGGLLVTCSCSGLVSRELFAEMLAKVAADAGRPLQVLGTSGPSADHPTSIHCLEGDYLKCFFCRSV